MAEPIGQEQDEMNLSEVIDKVSDLARKIYDYYSTELPKRHPNYPLVGPGDVTAPPPPEEDKLRNFLASLPDELLYQLLLIMYLGRGAFEIDDLAGYYETLRGEFTDREYAELELMDYAALADCLSDGLEELRKHQVERQRHAVEGNRAAEAVKFARRP